MLLFSELKGIRPVKELWLITRTHARTLRPYGTIQIWLLLLLYKVADATYRRQHWRHLVGRVFLCTSLQSARVSYLPQYQLPRRQSHVACKTTTLHNCGPIWIYKKPYHTHTHPFNGPFTGTIWMSRYQKGKTNVDFTEARDSEWHWHQLGHMQVCTSLQTDNHASTPPLSFLQVGCPSCRPTNSVEALKAN